MTFYIFVLLILGTVFGVVGDVFAKLWGLKNTIEYWYLAVIMYLLSSNIYIYFLKYEKLVIAYLFWALLSTLGCIFAGFLIFNEKLTFLQSVGMVFAVVSMLMMSLGK